MRTKLPKDVLLRGIAPMLESEEILVLARSSLALLQLLHEVELRREIPLKQYVQYRREECQPFLSALSHNETDQLRGNHGWTIASDQTHASAYETGPDAASGVSSSSSTSSTSTSDLSSSFWHRATDFLSIGRITSVRIGDITWLISPGFILPLLHLLPRSVRILTLGIDSLVSRDLAERDFTQLCLPSHLTELHFIGAKNVPVEEIEKLQQLEILEIEMDQLVRREVTVATNPAVKASPVCLTFPSSLRKLVLARFCLTLWSEPTLQLFVLPPALTSLELKQSFSIHRFYASHNEPILPSLETNELERYYELFPRLPETLTHFTFHNGELNALFIWMLQQNRLPLTLSTVGLNAPLSYEHNIEWIVQPPHAVIRKVVFVSGWAARTPLALPVRIRKKLTRISTLTSLTLPDVFETTHQLKELKCLTHLANLNVECLDITFPPSLRRLEMGEKYCGSMKEKEWNPPSTLTSISLGHEWSLPLTDLWLPVTIRHVRFGPKFYHPLPSEKYVWPPQLASLTLSSKRNQAAWPAYAKSVPAGCRLFVPSHVEQSGCVYKNRFAEWSEGYQCRMVSFSW